MRISDWSSDVCSSDLFGMDDRAGRVDIGDDDVVGAFGQRDLARIAAVLAGNGDVGGDEDGPAYPAGGVIQTAGRGHVFDQRLQARVHLGDAGDLAELTRQRVV